MKKVALLLNFFLMVALLYSQEQRLVLLEEFTQASCGPCASVNPSINNLLATNPEKITSIWYHTSWPGYDPMNNHNPQDVAARVSYYNFNYVPYSVLDGNFYRGNASGWNINTVNTRYAVPSPFSLKLRHEISAGQDSVYITLVAKASQAVSGTLVAHTAIIEKLIHFTNPPGSNGEKDFHNVMKKLLPNSGGFQMPTSMEAGDYVIVESSWKFANVYNVSEIAAVSFVQNNGNKEVHQSCNSSTDPLVMPYNNDLQVISVDGLPYSNCFGKISPLVTIRNNGNNAITTFEVKYRVNTGEWQSYTWSGNLASLKKAVITLPEYSYVPSGSDQLKIYSTAPNSANDEYPKNDTLNTSLKTGAVSTDRVFLFLRTDNAPQETTWDVKNSLGQVIQTGGPYSSPLTTYRDTIDLPVADCYVFTIYDADGNGICCANGSGGYELSDDEGTPVRKNGGTFGYSEEVEWRLNPPTALFEPTQDPEITIVPNPVNGQAKVGFTTFRNGDVNLHLFNTVGKNVKTIGAGYLNSGTHEVMLNTEGLAPGLYILQLQAGSKIWTRKVSVTR